MKNFEGIDIPEVNTPIANFLVKNILKDKLEFEADKSGIIGAIYFSARDYFENAIATYPIYQENKERFDDIMRIGQKYELNERKIMEELDRGDGITLKILMSPEYRLFKRHFWRLKQIAESKNMVELDQALGMYKNFSKELPMGEHAWEEMTFEMKKAIDDVIRTAQMRNKN